MEDFTTLFFELDSTVSVDSKIFSINNYLNRSTHEDSIWAIALLLGKVPKRTATTLELRTWRCDVSDTPDWLFEESLKITGDISETIAILLPEPQKTLKISLSEVVSQILSLKNSNEQEKKAIVFDIWDTLNRDSRYLFNKILTGSLKEISSNKIIIKALAKHLNDPETIISHRLMTPWSPETVTFEKLLKTPDSSEALSKPIPFYLARSLTVNIDDLGNTNDWAVEYKWDGLRGQLIKRQGKVFLWTRNEELVTDRFPEFNLIKKSEKDNFVLDGEILGWKEDKSLPLSALQKRFKRKTLNKKLLSDIPVAFIAYDQLEHNGKDIRHLSYVERRKKLGILIASFSPNSTILFSDEIKFSSWTGLENIRSNARAIGAEGLMIKKINSAYGIGRENSDWWKWKSEPFNVDAVLLYATRDNSFRSKNFSSFTFAVKHNDRYVSITKASIGLSEEELIDISAFVKKNTIESFGPVKSLKPELVFELSFEGISKSTRHKSGLIIRLPKIERWRKDKHPHEVNTLSDLITMLEHYG
ncbi:MAG: ATP-dependent DNA ligase [Saprospiraceae bacterium]|nr:ATP-dependent DNA ligase [Saprospiraceae bacterium]